MVRFVSLLVVALAQVAEGSNTSTCFQTNRQSKVVSKKQIGCVCEQKNTWAKEDTQSHNKRCTRTLVYGQRMRSSRQPCACPPTKQTWAQTGPEYRPNPRPRPRRHSPHRPQRHGLRPCCLVLLMPLLSVVPRKSCSWPPMKVDEKLNCELVMQTKGSRCRW